ncbi:MAG TPA: hypothetical protein VFP69_04755 [Streptomyces sp.]|nr:hypothetical protein [Streptomyces sp.]
MTMNTPDTADETTGGTARPAAATAGGPRAREAAGRGRHRRPRSRPRGPLLTAAGLALAAGALSLVRLLPDPGGVDVTEAAADQGPVPATDPVAHPGEATPDSAAPGDRPSAAPAGGADDARVSPGFGPDTATDALATDALAIGVFGTGTPGIGAGPTATLAPTALPAPAAPAPRVPETVTDPGPPRAPQPAPPSRPDPEPTPPGTAPAPAPPQEAGGTGLCVPLIGVCVDLGTGDRR